MALAYEPPGDGSIRQAELLSSVSELQAIDGGSAESGSEIEIRKVEHPLAIVLSQDCDLEQDCHLRFPDDADPLPRDEADHHPHSISHVILCDAYSESELLQRLPEGFGAKDRKRIYQNQNERYHTLDEGVVATGSQEYPVERLFLDFRRFFALPSPDLYDQLNGGSMGRVACLPAYYLHDLSQRFFSYQARVAIP
jgi:hypothetical protein